MTSGGVACAIDVNDFDQDIVDLAAEFAKSFQVDLDLVHVTIYPDPSIATWPAYVGSPNTMIKEDRRFKQVTTKVDGVNIRRHHLSGIPTDELLEFAKTHQPRLLVMGTHGRSGVSKLLGSVAASVLRRADCPVMVFRQRQNSQDFVDLKKEASQ